MADPKIDLRAGRVPEVQPFSKVYSVPPKACGRTSQITPPTFVATFLIYVFSSHRVIAGSPRNLGAPDWTSLK